MHSTSRTTAAERAGGDAARGGGVPAEARAREGQHPAPAAPLQPGGAQRRRQRDGAVQLAAGGLARPRAPRGRDPRPPRGGAAGAAASRRARRRPSPGVAVVWQRQAGRRPQGIVRHRHPRHAGAQRVPPEPAGVPRLPAIQVSPFLEAASWMIIHIPCYLFNFGGMFANFVFFMKLQDTGYKC